MECHVCLETFDAAERRPKVLPCGHTFCLRCLQGLQAKRCPFDQKVFESAPGELADNFTVLQLSSKPAQHSAFRLWCKSCQKEAVAVCVDEHAVCRFEKARANELEPLQEELELLRKGLDQLGLTLDDAASGLDVESSRSKLKQAKSGVVTAMFGLQRAQWSDAAEWAEAKQDAVPCGLSRCAAQLAADLADPSTKCKVTVRRGEAGGVAWSGEVRPAESAAARLLLCQLACHGGLPQVAEERPAVPRWQERPNELTQEEIVAKVKVGSRVARGRDWKEEWTYDGTPPGPGVVTKIDEEYVWVKWDNKEDVRFVMGPNGTYQLRLLATTPLDPCFETTVKLWDVSLVSAKVDISKMTSVSTRSDLAEVRSLVGLDCGPSPLWSHKLLQQVAPNLESLQMVSSEQRHLDVVVAMPRLQELCITGVTGQQLRQVAQMASLRRLQVHCPFDAPLSVQELPATALTWLVCGVYPLAAALALVRASADTLEELELVAASKEPYGCPDLAAELRRCGLKKLKRLMLLRVTGYDDFCRYDADSCEAQKVQLWNMFLEEGLAVYVDCFGCTNC